MRDKNRVWVSHRWRESPSVRCSEGTNHFILMETGTRVRWLTQRLFNKFQSQCGSLGQLNVLTRFHKAQWNLLRGLFLRQLYHWPFTGSKLRPHLGPKNADFCHLFFVFQSIFPFSFSSPASSAPSFSPYLFPTSLPPLPPPPPLILTVILTSHCLLQSMNFIIQTLHVCACVCVEYQKLHQALTSKNRRQTGKQSRKKAKPQKKNGRRKYVCSAVIKVCIMLLLEFGWCYI